MPTDPHSLEVPQEQLSPAAKRLLAVQQEILARRNAVVPPPAPQPVPRCHCRKDPVGNGRGPKT